jgi:hypothetical protein
VPGHHTHGGGETGPGEINTLTVSGGSSSKYSMNKKNMYKKSIDSSSIPSYHYQQASLDQILKSGDNYSMDNYYNKFSTAERKTTGKNHLPLHN